MTRALAIDLGPRIRVNAIEPAAIETEMLLTGFGKDSKSYQELSSFHPLDRIGEAKEVASAALWLASDNCRFIHGECIRIDGGISSRLHDPD
jgi:NAD(P)-dependent dehydrogenase (short-subunit alcohol dehydrogenase family)